MDHQGFPQYRCPSRESVKTGTVFRSLDAHFGLRKEKDRKMGRYGAFAVGILSTAQTPPAAQIEVAVSAVAKSRIITLY